MSVHLKNEVNKSLKNSIELIDILSKNIDENSYVLFNGGSVRTHVQALIESIKTEISPDKQIVDVILSHGVSAELTSPCGFEVYLKDLRQRLISEENFEQQILSESSLPNEEVIDRYIDENTRGLSDVVRDMIKTSIKLAGIHGRISIELTKSLHKSVELVTGYNFDLCPMFKAQCAFLECRVIPIDGYIESVGEAHKLFQDVFESKIAAVIFSRGMSDEVLQTIKVNYDRGTMKIVPFDVPLDVHNVNTLNDIAVVSGGDVLSTNKGELISTIDVNSYPIVDRVDVHENSISITCENTKNSVNAHIKTLLAKRDSQSADERFEYSSLYDARLRSLSQSRVIVRVNESDNVFYTQSFLDRIYRGIRAMSEHGYTIVDEKIVPVMSLHAGKLYAVRCVSILKNIDCVVTREKKNAQ